MKKNNAILADLGRMWKHIRDDEKKNEHEPNAKRQFEIANNINSFIPLKDANDLDLLEEQLKTEDFKNAMLDALMKRGGKNVEDLTNNIMAKVFTNELASDFSMRGKQKKKTLLDFKIASCIIEAIMASENSKEDYIHKQMGKWLANAPVRLSRNRAKKEKAELIKNN
nr:PREDICTED: uncharacterized protein LOC105669785 [Linepithema humile]